MEKTLNSTPRVSLIIPTHNRASLLEKNLVALCRQTCSRDEFEVVVVADGCTDKTSEIVGLFVNHLHIRLIEQGNLGAAGARNHGAAEARGDLLVFLDDDIEVLPGFVQAHQTAHLEDEYKVLIGYYPPLLTNQKGYLKAELRLWWMTLFQKMGEPGHRFLYTDLLSGNFSLSKRMYQKVGGFDPGYRCHEDYDLGIRLLRAGAGFKFVRQAEGYHHEESGMGRVLTRKYEEGIADVIIGQKYPALRPTLLMARLQEHSLFPSRVLKLLAFAWPRAGDKLTGNFKKWLAFFEKIRWYAIWKRLLYGLMGYWYWRGVSERLSTIREVNHFLSEGTQTAPQHLTLEIDLEEGITTLEASLDAYRPDEIIIRLNQNLVGCIRNQPGAEKLRAAHLRSILARDFPVPLLNALIKDPNFAYPEAIERLTELYGEFMKKRKFQDANFIGELI